MRGDPFEYASGFRCVPEISRLCIVFLLFLSYRFCQSHVVFLVRLIKLILKLVWFWWNNISNSEFLRLLRVLQYDDVVRAVEVIVVCPSFCAKIRFFFFFHYNNAIVLYHNIQHNDSRKKKRRTLKMQKQHNNNYNNNNNCRVLSMVIK